MKSIHIPCILLASVMAILACSCQRIEGTTMSVHLTSMVFSSARAPELTPPFSPEESEYTVEMSRLQESITVTATANSPNAILTVAGTEAPLGVPSQPVPLALDDDTGIDIALFHPDGFGQPYRVNVRRAVEILQAAYAKASNTDAEDQFGYSVALSASGDTLAVGASLEDSTATGVDGDPSADGASNSGAVYVFARSEQTWRLQAYLKASNTNAGDEFGLEVGLSGLGDTLAVGAYQESSAAEGIDGDQGDNSASASGAVYVFTRSGQTWQQQAYLKASNTDSDDLFGRRVALSGSGDILAVGAYQESSAADEINGDQSDNSEFQSGAVYVFARSEQTWRQHTYLKASNSGKWDTFGRSVALSSSGDTLAVGAPGEASAANVIDGDDSDDSAPASGAVYVFARSGQTWQQQAYVKASNAEASDEFGVSVALSGSGDTLAVGALREDSEAIGVDGNQNDNSAIESGAAYVFTRSGHTWQQQAYVKASNTGDLDVFGVDVALSGSGDTLAVGAYRERSLATGVDGDQGDGSYNSGAAYVFTRSGQTWQEHAYVKASNTDVSDLFGLSVALSASGDTLAVGAPMEDSAAAGVDGNQDDNSADDSGAVYIFH